MNTPLPWDETDDDNLDDWGGAIGMTTPPAGQPDKAKVDYRETIHAIKDLVISFVEIEVGQLREIEAKLKPILATIEAVIREAQMDSARMREAINKILADSESGKGWGPDVTTCEYLRQAATLPKEGVE